jgi:hypothetical protein
VLLYILSCKAGTQLQTTATITMKRHSQLWGWLPQPFLSTLVLLWLRLHHELPCNQAGSDLDFTWRWRERERERETVKEWKWSNQFQCPRSLFIPARHQQQHSCWVAENRTGICSKSHCHFCSLAHSFLIINWNNVWNVWYLELYLTQEYWGIFGSLRLSYKWDREFLHTHAGFETCASLYLNQAVLEE